MIRIAGKTAVQVKALMSEPLREVVLPEAEILLKVAELFVNDMRLMLSKAGTGKTYTKEIRVFGDPKRPRIVRTRDYPDGVPKAPHTASSPGAPPTSESGDLLRALGIELKVVRVNEVVVGVGVMGAPHWKYLEFGTIWMEPRPFVRVSYQRMQKVAEELLAKELTKRAQKVGFRYRRMSR